jgi:hypothetical protein
MVPALYQLSYESPKTPGGARTHDLRKRSVVLAARRTVPLRGQYRIRTCVSGYLKRAVSGIRTHDVNFIWPAWKAGAIDQLGDYRNKLWCSPVYKGLETNTSLGTRHLTIPLSTSALFGLRQSPPAGTGLNPDTCHLSLLSDSNRRPHPYQGCALTN